MSLLKKEKKNCFGNCGNAIADNVKKKKFILTIVAIPLLKMEKKKLWNMWMSKKKSCHVYNIFTINHTWLIIISSKNLWQINCGNSIAKNVKKIKKKFILAIVAIPLPKMEKKNYEICEWVKKKLSRTQYFHNKSHVINYY